VSCAAALATLELIEGGLVDNAAKVGGQLMGGLREIEERHPIVRDVRGLGMMIGVGFEDHDTADRVEKAAFRRGLLVLGCGDDAVRISPPLVLREDQAETGLAVFEEAIAEVEAG
jgi:4-aminobutyrate aminotransferase